jgi:hypothetical protein
MLLRLENFEPNITKFVSYFQCGIALLAKVEVIPSDVVVVCASLLGKSTSCVVVVVKEVTWLPSCCWT